MAKLNPCNPGKKNKNINCFGRDFPEKIFILFGKCLKNNHKNNLKMFLFSKNQYNKTQSEYYTKHLAKSTQTNSNSAASYCYPYVM